MKNKHRASNFDNNRKDKNMGSAVKGKKILLRCLLIVAVIIALIISYAIIIDSIPIDFAGRWVLSPYNDTDFSVYPGDLELFKDGTGRLIAWSGPNEPVDSGMVYWTKDDRNLTIRIRNDWDGTVQTIQYRYSPKYWRILFLGFKKHNEIELRYIYDENGNYTFWGERYSKR